ncbi:MAG: hypothetical protein HYZ53_06055 [Planctomycetes bacterium]|nr:hypothetical protein [Planctomycetota bacterium]
MRRLNFWRDEDGQGMAECVILAPIYVVLAYGVLMFGEMGVLKKKAMEAARFAAWEPSATESDLREDFFKNVSHDIDITTGENAEVKVSYKPTEVVRFIAHHMYWGGTEPVLGETLEISGKGSCKRP